MKEIVNEQWKARLQAAYKPITACANPPGTTCDTSSEEDFEDFVDTLAKIGISETIGAVDLLNDAEIYKFGDYREALKDYPIAVVRISWRELHGGKKEQAMAITAEGCADERTVQLKALGFKVKLEDASIALLLPLYAADKPSDPVTLALKKRFNDKAVIAFRDDGTVAVTETVQYISDLEQGYPERETITVDDQLVKLWPVGTKPNTMVEEDPLFPGVPLRNGYSMVNSRNWKAVPPAMRQLCRIIVERGDVDPNNKEAALRLLERAVTVDGLRNAYPEAWLEFRQKLAKDDLPKLKVLLGTPGARPNNPFGVRRQY